MKRLTMLTAVVAVGCTVTVKPLPPQKPTKHSTRHSETRSKPASHKTSSSDNVKETWWIENYHKLEAYHGDYTIPDDDNIKPLPDGKFIVPDNVITHYQDLLLAKPTPTGTPTY